MENKSTELAQTPPFCKTDVRRSNFSEHYGEFWEKVEDLVDEDGWVYGKEAPPLLDSAFENITDKEKKKKKSLKITCFLRNSEKKVYLRLNSDTKIS